MTRKKRYLDDNPPTSNKTSEELIREIEYRHSKKGQKELRERLQEEKDNKISEFGSIDVPKSTRLQYSWRRLANAKGSELLYALPGVGEIMFGVDIADKAKQGNIKGVLADLGLYGVMTYAPELRNIGKKIRKSITRKSKLSSTKNIQNNNIVENSLQNNLIEENNIPTIRVNLRPIPIVEGSVDMPNYNQLHPEARRWSDAVLENLTNETNRLRGEDNYSTIVEPLIQNSDRKINRIHQLETEATNRQFSHLPNTMTDDEYRNGIREARELYQKYRENPQQFEIQTSNNPIETQQSSSRIVHHLDADLDKLDDVPYIYPYGKETENVSGKIIHYVDEPTYIEQDFIKAEDFRIVNTKNGPVRIYKTNSPFLRTLSSDDKRHAYYEELTPEQVQEKLNYDFDFIPHGGQAALIEHDDLSTDSYPLFIKEALRRQARNEGYLDMVTDHYGNPLYQILNDMGNIVRKGKKINLLRRQQDFIDYANKRLTIQIPEAIQDDRGIYVPSLKFYKYKLGGSINNRLSLKHGGIYIKPSHRGRFTALKERTGHSTIWFKENGTPAQKKMATFALNAAKWKH